MRYTYTITNEAGEHDSELKAMRYKKMLKSLFMKYPKFTGWITYINKKGRTIVKSFRNGRNNTYGDNQYDYDGKETKGKR